TVLQNRWQAATIHWACQFAGIIVTPLNWRFTAEELDFCVDDGEAKAIVYEEVSAAAVRSSNRARARQCIAVGEARSQDLAFESLIGGGGPAGRPRVTAQGPSGVLHYSRPTARPPSLPPRPHCAPQRRAAPPTRGARRRARPRRAESLRGARAHARRHAALPYDGRAFAAGHVVDRRRLRLPAAFRRCARARTDRGRAHHQPLSRADALP